MNPEHEARLIVETVLKQPVRSISRFQTGMAHLVYDIVTADGRPVVARLAQLGQEATLHGAVFWSEKLRPLGVPLPELLAHDLTQKHFSHAYLLLERLPGRDLGDVYPTLTPNQKRELAGEIARNQQIVNSLPAGPGYGFATTYQANLKASWGEVVLSSLDRSRSWIEQGNVFKIELVDRVQTRLARFEPYFASIPPKPFLDDTTTKNVIIDRGKLSGIVDVDMVCFGDPLFTVALTRMALLSLDYDLDYIEYWCNHLNLSALQRQVLSGYTALFCVSFMGEIGQKFNRDEPIPAESSKIERFYSILDRLLAELA